MDGHRAHPDRGQDPGPEPTGGGSGARAPRPAPTAPRARQLRARVPAGLSIRERVDRELRGSMVAAVAHLPRRPSEGWDNVARGHVRPAGKLPDRWIEAAEAQADLDLLEAGALEGVRRAFAALRAHVDHAA